MTERGRVRTAGGSARSRSSGTDSGTMRVSPCLRDPAGYAFAHFHAESTQCLLLPTGCERVGELPG